MQEGGIAQFTIHRNTYQGVNLNDVEKFSISLIYDRDESDLSIGNNLGVLDVTTDIALFLEIHGQAGTIRSQGFVRGIDKSKLKISIDFIRSWEALVMVESEIFLDLRNMDEG